MENHLVLSPQADREFALLWDRSSWYAAAGSRHVGKGLTACRCVRELVACWHGACGMGVRAGLVPHAEHLAFFNCHEDPPEEEPLLAPALPPAQRYGKCLRLVQ